MNMDVSLSRFKDSKLEFWKELQVYYCNGLFSDLEIIGANQQKILCHKLVLASVSGTFLSVLSSNREDEVTRVLIPELDINELDIYLKDLYSCLAYGRDYDTIQFSHSLGSLLHLETVNDDFKWNPVWNGGEVKVKVEEEISTNSSSRNTRPSTSSNLPKRKRKLDWDIEDMTENAGEHFDHDYYYYDQDEDEEEGEELEEEKREVKMKLVKPDESLINTEINVSGSSETVEHLIEVSDINERRKVYNAMKAGDSSVNVKVLTEGFNYKQFFRYQHFGYSKRKKPYFLALVGVVGSSQSSQVKAKPLAWSFPFSDDLHQQFDNVFGAFRSVFGFSDSDICYNSMMRSRQGKFSQHRGSKVKHNMKRRYADFTHEQLQGLLEKPDVLKATKRYPKKSDFKLDDSQIHLTLDANLDAKNFDGVFLLDWKDETKIEARIIHVNEDDMDEASKYLMNMVFDVWTLERNISRRKFIPDCPYLCKKYDELIIPMETLAVVKEFENDVDGKMRNEILNNSKTCPDCGKAFSCVTVNQHLRFNQHKRLHYYEKFECNCFYECTSIRDKMNHVRLCHNSENYEKCKFCDYIGNKKYMDAHKCKGKVEAGEYQEKIIFSVTERTLKSSKEVPNLIMLGRKRKKQNDSENSNSEKGSRSKVKSEEEKSGFICCDEYFDNFYAISRHVKSHHIIDKDVKCGKCNFFGNYKSVNQHQVRAHKSVAIDELNFVCEVCGKAQKSKASLQAHISNFHVKRNCHLCDMEFTVVSSLKLHLMKVHNVGKPARSPPCEVCGKEFPNKHRLKVHFINSHMEDKDKPHICDQCGRGFALKFALTTHQMQAHIKARPFKCRYGCGADYNDHASRGTHELKKHGKRLTIKDEEEANRT